MSFLTEPLLKCVIRPPIDSSFGSCAVLRRSSAMAVGAGMLCTASIRLGVSSSQLCPGLRDRSNRSSSTRARR